MHRVRILADLHWKLPRPLTAEEQRLRDVMLPSLEAAVGKLKHSLEVIPAQSPITADLCACPGACHRWLNVCKSFLLSAAETGPVGHDWGGHHVGACREETAVHLCCTNNDDGMVPEQQVFKCMSICLQGSKRSLHTMKSERKLIRQRSSGTPIVSSVQLRRTRAAVAEQAAVTSSGKQALQQMQLWLQNIEEKCYA